MKFFWSFIKVVECVATKWLEMFFVVVLVVNVFNNKTQEQDLRNETQFT